MSVRGASSAVPSDVDLQQYEGAIEKQNANIFPQLGTNIIQLLLFSFNSGDGGKGVVRYHIDCVSECREMVIGS